MAYNVTVMLKTFFDRARAIHIGFATTSRYLLKPDVTINYAE